MSYLNDPVAYSEYQSRIAEAERRQIQFDRFGTPDSDVIAATLAARAACKQPATEQSASQLVNQKGLYNADL